MKKFKLIVPSFVALIFCMLLIAGSTFALFTSQASASIAVTSGKVQISATLGEPKLYSADATLTSGDLAGTITESTKTDDNESYANYAGTYYFKQQTGTFANGGTAVVANNTLTLSKMTPGDKAEAGLAIVNSSNVNIKYRLILEAHASGKNDDNVDNADLLSVLKVTFFDKTYIGLSKFVSAWMFREAVETPENLDTGLVIELPLLTDNHYQDLEVSYTITVEAVQGNAKTVDAGLTEYVDKPATQTGTAATTVTQETASASIKLTTTTTPLQEGTTIAEFNNAFEVASEGESTVKLDVETAPFETASETSYTVVNNDDTPVASVDLNLTVDGETVSTFKAGGSSKITTYIVKGLSHVDIVYNGESTKAFGNGGTRVYDDRNAVDTVGEYYYDNETGELIFMTDHFSEYVPYTEDDIVCINESENIVFTSLEAGFASAEQGGQLKLLSNATVKHIITLNNDKTYVLDLNGKTITVDLLEAGRPFLFSTGSTLVVNANNGTIYNNGKAYGLFRMQNPGTKLVLNGGTYYSYDAQGSAVIWVGSVNNTITHSVEIELNNINAECVGQFVRDGSNSYYYSEIAKLEGVKSNKISVNGGSFNFKNAGYNVGGSISGFVFSYSDVAFNGVTATSQIGSIMELDGGKGLFNNNNFNVEDQNTIQSWNATTIGISYDAVATINSGTYTGYYGVSIFTHGGTFNINGGTFTGTSGHALDIYQKDYCSNCDSDIPATCNINGGLFIGDINLQGDSILVANGIDYKTGNVWIGQTYEKLSSRPWLKNDKFVAAPSQAEQIANTNNGSNIIAADDDEEFASYVGQATAYVQSIQNDTTLGINITDLGNQSGVLHVTNAKGLAFLSQFTDYLSALNAIEASKGNWYSNYYYYWNWTISVDCDINLCNITWRPLDDPSCVVDFNNHTISNLHVYNKNSAGLFNLASKGVRNLTIDHATVTADGIGDSCAGALAGSAHGTVQNITVKNSTVSNAKYSAVLVGYSYANITNCTVQDSSVDGRYKTGSLVGYLCSNTSGLVSNNTIKNVAVSTTNVLPGKTAVNGTVIGQFNAPGQCINNVLVNVTGASVKVGDTNGHTVEVD